MATMLPQNMKPNAADLAKFQNSYKKLQELEENRNKSIVAKQQLDSQLTENQMVKDEIKIMSSDCVIYKMVGPALIKQDFEEVKMNVDSRISHLNGEIKRQDDLVTKGIEEKKQIEADMKALEQKLFASMEASGMIQKKQ